MNTMKDLLERAITGTLAQGKPSLSEGVPAYRGECNTKCPVGMLIADEWYSDSFEGLAVPYPIVRYAIEKSNNITLTDEDVELLYHLQGCHDVGAKDDQAFAAKFYFWVRSCVLDRKLPDYCLDFL